MKLYDHPLYREDLALACAEPLPWEKLEGTCVVVTGASGSIASFLVDLLLEKRIPGMRVVAVVRNVENARSRFEQHAGREDFQLVSWDVNQEAPAGTLPEKTDYILHAASNTHPLAYAKDPIGSLATNVMGTAHLLDYAAASQARRFVFCSSVEIYGQNRGDTEAFREDYCGYLDCNTLRAAYPEGKRAGEALCQAYLQQRGVDFVAPRLARVYGPALLRSDTKALSQFIWNAVRREDIVLKSEGRQLYSYLYMADAALGLMYCMLLGETGHAYNLADPASDVTLRELAAMLAKTAGKQVVFDLPSELERKGYSTATKALLDAAKARGLGWKAHYGIAEGLERTVAVLRETLKETL